MNEQICDNVKENIIKWRQIKTLPFSPVINTKNLVLLYTSKPLSGDLKGQVQHQVVKRLLGKA